MFIVTAGPEYIDIDAYACMVAYAELLNKTGQPAIAASDAVLNESIPVSLRALPATLQTGYQQAPEDRFILVDVSDPTKFASFVDNEKIAEVIDHHPLFESYWTERIGSGSRIEFIGAAATLVYERWREADRLNEMSRTSATLLAAAVLDNTLNFGATLTTDRDRAAYEFLAAQADLDDSFPETYFSECQASVMKDLSNALSNDSKRLEFPGFKEVYTGQLVVWDARPVLVDYLETISSTLSKTNEDWLANIVSLSENRSYFLTDREPVRRWLSRLTGAGFKGDTATADRMWLRKELLKKANEAADDA